MFSSAVETLSCILVCVVSGINRCFLLLLTLCQLHTLATGLLQVATLGKSGVSVGYYDTEINAARAYDRAAIGLLGRDNCSITTNFPLQDYDQEVVPQLIGKTREEVKTTLKNERAKVSSMHSALKALQMLLPPISAHQRRGMTALLSHCIWKAQTVLFLVLIDLWQESLCGTVL